MSKNSPRTSVLRDNDLIRRGDAKQCCTDELRNTMQLLSNPPQSSAAWDARNAINAIPAVQPTVKPLVWRDDGTNGHETDHAFGFYEVYPSPEGDMLSRDGVDSGVFPTLEAAKAAAQADYEARILSALDMQPTVSPELLATTHDVAALERILRERGAVFDAMVDAAEDAAGKDVSFNVVIGRALRATLARVKGETK